LTEYLGEPTDSLKETVQEFISDKASHVAEVAGNAFEAAAEEARSQGLTLEEAKAAGEKLQQKAGRVAEAATKGSS
jgi:hypothetical protein